MNDIMLRYTGDGAALPDVPARDLSAAEAEAYADDAAGRYGVAGLLLSGLYELATPAEEDQDGGGT